MFVYNLTLVEHSASWQPYCSACYCSTPSAYASCPCKQRRKQISIQQLELRRQHRQRNQKSMSPPPCDPRKATKTFRATTAFTMADQLISPSRSMNQLRKWTRVRLCSGSIEAGSKLKFKTWPNRLGGQLNYQQQQPPRQSQLSLQRHNTNKTKWTIFY